MVLQWPGNQLIHFLSVCSFDLDGETFWVGGMKQFLPSQISLEKMMLKLEEAELIPLIIVVLLSRYYQSNTLQDLFKGVSLEVIICLIY